MGKLLRGGPIVHAARPRNKMAFAGPDGRELKGLSVLGLKRIFAGTYHDPEKLWDYSATAVRFEMSEPAAFHVGGDLKERASGFGVALSPRTIPVLRTPLR